MNAKDNLCGWYTNCKFKMCFEIQSTLRHKAEMVGKSASTDTNPMEILAVGLLLFHVEHFAWNIKRCVYFPKRTHLNTMIKLNGCNTCNIVVSIN